VIAGFALSAVLLVVIVATVLERRKARDASKAAYDAVVALSDVARHASELAELEMRTAASMGRGSFVSERNPTAQAAKMRGYEVWRNSHIEPAQRQLRAAYRRYESATRRLIEIVQKSAVGHAWDDSKTWARSKREAWAKRRTRKARPIDYSKILDTPPVQLPPGREE
jgi:hypothetical protein